MRAALIAAVLLPSLFANAPAGAEPGAEPGAESGTRLYSLYEATPVDRMPRAMRRAYRRAILAKLAELGYLARGGASDAASQDIRAAVQAYQRDAGLPIDGVMSKEMLDHMVFIRPQSRAGQERISRITLTPPAPPLAREPEIRLKPPKLKLHRLPSPPAEARPAPDDAVTVEPVPPVRSRPPAVPRRTGTVSRGGGGFVSRIQRELTALGYYDGPIDGMYGRSTASAVRRFQQDKGLPVTGAIDARLLNALSLG